MFEDNRQEKYRYYSEFFSGKAATTINQDLAVLFELSVDAYYSALYAGMSELPITEEISRYINKVGKTSNREMAARAAFNREDPDVFAILNAAWKVQHEIHRMTGLLRFNADSRGVYTARCSPDHFILPALADHFTLRFGETPWAILDEKRGLCLCRTGNGPVQLIPASLSAIIPEQQDPLPESEIQWEELWRLYHRSINIESRKNTQLQRQFMPERYHKYLPEMK